MNPRDDDDAAWIARRQEKERKETWGGAVGTKKKFGKRGAAKPLIESTRKQDEGIDATHETVSITCHLSIRNVVLCLRVRNVPNSALAIPSPRLTDRPPCPSTSVESMVDAQEDGLPS